MNLHFFLCRFMEQDAFLILFVRSLFPLQHLLFSPVPSVLFFVHCCTSLQSFQGAVTRLWGRQSGDTQMHFFPKVWSGVTTSTVKKTQCCHCLEAPWSGELQHPQRKAFTILCFSFSYLQSAPNVYRDCHLKVLLRGKQQYILCLFCFMSFHLCGIVWQLLFCMESHH